jgi:signal transduction histidine kinase
MLVSVVRDITQMKKNEKEIRELNTELEGRVGQRTMELENANAALSDSLEELKHTQKSLVEAEKMASLGVLVAGVAHEINTPVGVGVTAASHLKQQTQEILKRYSAGDIRRSELEAYFSTADESAGVILENLNKASDHIKSFKNVAVDQASKKMRKFMLKEYVGDVIMSLNPVIRETRHQVILTGEDELEVESVPGSVSQVVTNLVMNSLKHAFEGIEKGLVAIDISREKGNAVIRYSDDGNGMREDVLVRVFDPFFTTKRGSGGSGLGMHIVYNLVTQSLGGEIECRSSVGKGTKILIKIPLGTK